MKMKMKITKLVLIFVAILIALNTISYAAGSFNISSSKTTIDKGETVTLSIKGNNAYGKVVITATNATVSSSTVFLQNDTQEVKITSTSTEDIKVTVSPDPTYGLGDGEENPIIDSKSLTIKVNKPQTNVGGQTTPTTPSTPSTPTTLEKSSNANVKMIETSPVDFTGFKSNKTSGYEVTVENNVDRITFKVDKEDSKASVSLLNKTNSDTGKSWVYIAEGNNEIDVTVTAEDGKTKKTYTINVTRKAKEEIEEPEEDEPVEEQPIEDPMEDPMEEAFGLTELEINGYELEPQFQTDIYEYKIDLKDDIQKFNITTLATEVNSTVEITGNENFIEGENIITITVKGEAEEKIATYQIIVNKTMLVVEIENTINMEEDHQQMISKIIIIAVAAGVILLIVIVAIVIKVKNSRTIDDGYIPYENVFNSYEDNTEEELIQNDEDGFVDEESKRKRRSKGKRFK